MDGPGGVYLGLIRDTDKSIRPSFLGQTSVKSFQVDLTDVDHKSLVLSSSDGRSLLSNTPNADEDYIPLIRDLNRRFGDPAYHYTAKAASLSVNGHRLFPDNKQPIYVIFDTGVTGMVVSSEIFDERYHSARRNREKNLWGKVEITMTSKNGHPMAFEASSPVTTPFGQRPWPRFRNAHLVVMGLAFLDNHCMTIDINQMKLWFQ